MATAAIRAARLECGADKCGPYKTTLPGPSIVAAPHWASHDRLIKPRFTLQAFPGDEEPRDYAGPTPLLALGLLTMEHQVERRDLARRTMHARFRSLLRREVVVLRYLLPQLLPPCQQQTSSSSSSSSDDSTCRPANSDDYSADLAAENTTHGDLLRMPTPEGATRCWQKVILWMRHALATWPALQFVGVADDDVYLSLPRLAADFAQLRAAGHRRVYWGQPMWMGYWNDSRFEGELFGGTMAEKDEKALFDFGTRRRRLRRLNASALIGRLDLAPPTKDARRASIGTCATYDANGGWSGRQMASGPFFFANTDLAVLGSDLARRVVDGQCLANLAASLATAEAKGHWRRRFEYPCEPNIDQLLGWLVAHAARNVTYVQAQFHTQGFPWMTYQHNRPDHRSMYVHKLGSDTWTWRYTDALLAREGPFERMPRACRPCYDATDAGASWVTRGSPSASLYSRWTCCATLPREMAGADALERCKRERGEAAAMRSSRGGGGGGPASGTFRFRGRSMELRDGYCAPTDDTDTWQHGNRSCARTANEDAKGYWKFMGTPLYAHSLSDCVRRCLACAACKYISFSESHFQRECSWYASCPAYESNALSRIGSELCPTFSTVRVRE